MDFRFALGFSLENFTLDFGLNAEELDRYMSVITNFTLYYK